MVFHFKYHFTLQLTTYIQYTCLFLFIYNKSKGSYHISSVWTVSARERVRQKGRAKERMFEYKLCLSLIISKQTTLIIITRMSHVYWKCMLETVVIFMTLYLLFNIIWRHCKIASKYIMLRGCHIIYFSFFTYMRSA